MIFCQKTLVYKHQGRYALIRQGVLAVSHLARFSAGFIIDGQLKLPILTYQVIQRKKRDGKTYFVINDYEKLRALFAQLLGEIQRIKSEGDYEAGKQLIETYAVHIDPELHKEVKARYEALDLKPYGGFVNPEIQPVVDGSGAIVDYIPVYTDDYLAQMLLYGKKYGTL